MEYKIKEVTKLLLQGSINKDEADEMLLDLFSNNIFSKIKWISLSEPTEYEKLIEKLNNETLPKMFEAYKIPKELF